MEKVSRGKKSKILFTDLDDTLLDRKKQITPENRQAVYRAACQGHRVVICTGRPLMGISCQIEELGMGRPGSYAIANNGGLIYDCFRKRVIYEKRLPIPYVKYIFQKSRQYGLFCQTYSDTHLLAPCRSPELEDYLAKSSMPCRIDPAIPDTLEVDPPKALVIGPEDQRQLNAYLESMGKWAEDKVSMFYSSNCYLEHVPLGVSKGAAVQWLCGYLGVPEENTVAVGDAQNDISMLEAAQVGAAMSNATAECKAAAGYITEKDCGHGGVAEVIDKFILQ